MKFSKFFCFFGFHQYIVIFKRRLFLEKKGSRTDQVYTEEVIAQVLKCKKCGLECGEFHNWNGAVFKVHPDLIREFKD